MIKDQLINFVVNFNLSLLLQLIKTVVICNITGVNDI